MRFSRLKHNLKFLQHKSQVQPVHHPPSTEKMKYYLPFLFLLFLIGCAQIVQPTGGDRDEDPPVLDTLRSTPNFQTNFKKQELEFWFDEFVQLKDVFSQVVTSPPLRYDPPDLYIRKKSVRLEFDEREELKENATYVINFGEAIRDITENNPTELRYVFSTGDFIDSLSVGGKVKDSFSGDPVEDILVMLYDNLADSVVYTERPFYFARTDKNGNFKIQNLRADTFKIFVLKDSNLDYLYNADTEQIGFSDSLLIVSDSLQPKDLRLSAFTADPKARLLEDNQEGYGVVRLLFDRSPTEAKIDYFDFGQTVVKEVKDDSLLLWYDDPAGGTWDFYVGEGEYIDTLTVEAFSKTEYLKTDTFFLENKKFGTQKLNPTKPIKLIFNHPVDSIVTDSILFTTDTLRTPVKNSIAVDSIEKRTLNLTFKPKTGVTYDLTLLPGAVYDIYGASNRDTVEISYETADIKEFGNINLTVDSLDASINYVFELLLKDQVIKSLKAGGTEQFTYNFVALPPGSYRLRIIEDTDGNGRWSPGDYDERRQSERVFEKSIEALRANWDVEAEISIE